MLIASCNFFSILHYPSQPDADLMSDGVLHRKRYGLPKIANYKAVPLKNEEDFQRKEMISFQNAYAPVAFCVRKTPERIREEVEVKT